MDARDVTPLLPQENIIKRKRGKICQVVGEFSNDLKKYLPLGFVGDKELRYDIKKDVNLSYKNGGGVLKNITVDQDIVSLSRQLRTYKTIDIYVKSSNVRHEKKLPEVLWSDSDSNNDSDVRRDNDYELLVNVPFIIQNSGVDEETKEAREKLMFN